MKRLFCIIGIICIAATSTAQSFEELKRQAQQEFASFKQKATDEYEDFRQQANKEYAEYMRKAWAMYNSQPAIPVPKRPEPPTPVVKDPNKAPLTTPQPLIIPKAVPSPKPTPVPNPEQVPDKPIPTPKPTPKQTPTKPVPTPSHKTTPEPAPTPTPKTVPASVPTFSFEYYGTPCVVTLDDSYRFKLPEVSNSAIADAWDRLASQKFYNLVDEIEKLRDKLSLCDWGYVKLTEALTQAFYGKSATNEARIMQAFILTQSGYKIRMAYSNNKVAILLGSKTKNIYRYSYVTIGCTTYYILDRFAGSCKLYICDREFPNERYCSIEAVSLPNLRYKQSATRTLRARKYSNANVEVAVNQNLIDFYNEYPMMDWNFYLKAPLSKQTRTKLYKSLRSAIDSKSKTEAANILINFVQTAFEYKTDQEQFGVERPLFAEETLFYPYSDCEDRSILYATLVRDLLGLDVILLHYPNHLATAVNFGHDIPGQYLDYKGKRYFICDPTYIGASIGEAMPNLDNSKIEIIEID